MELYRILPKYDFSFNENEMKLFLSTLSSVKKKKLKFKGFTSLIDHLMIVKTHELIIQCNSKGQVDYYFRTHADDKSHVLSALETLFKGSGEVFLESEDIEPYDTINSLYKANNEGSLKSYDEAVYNHMIAMLKPNTRIRVLFDVKRRRFTMTNDKRELRSLEGQDNFQIITNILVEAKTKYQRNEAKIMVQTLRDITSLSTELHYKFKEDYIDSVCDADEMMNLLGFATIDAFADKKSKVNFLDKGQVTLAPNTYNTGAKIGFVDHPTQHNREVRIPWQWFTKHTFIGGTSGSGKSTVLVEIINDNLLQRLNSPKALHPGFTIFDPGKQLCFTILNRIRYFEEQGNDVTELLKKIHYIDLAHDDSNFTINLLDKGMDNTMLLDFLKGLFGGGATPLLDKMLMSSLEALLLDKKEHTIADAKKLLEDENYRKKIVRGLEANPEAIEVIKFLKQDENFKPMNIQSTLNRLNPFINTAKSRKLFGSIENQLKQIKKWMDDGHIVLFNIADLSKFSIQVIMGFIILKYYSIGKTRALGSIFHGLIIDEAHRAQIDDIESLLSEIRKFNIGLFPTTQYIEQLNRTYRDAISNTVSNRIFFRMGSDTASKAAQMTNGEIEASSLRNLQDLSAFFSNEKGAFKIKVTPPYRYHQTKLVDYTNDKALGQCSQADEDYGIKLMLRDYSTKKVKTMPAAIDYEDELL